MAQASATPIDSSPVSDSTVQNDPILTLAPEDIPNVEDVEHLITEDDTPVDNMFSEKQRRLLTRSLYASWKGPGPNRPFLAASDVGIFRSVNEPPVVPDVFLSLDVIPPEDWWIKKGRSYFIWEYHKPPDVVIEVVSNAKGGETDTKVERYAQFGVPYYVIFDPIEQVQEGRLRIYELTSIRTYRELSVDFLPSIGLGLQLWRGIFEKREATWLRWQDASGTLLVTGEERSEQAEKRAEQERTRAQHAEEQAEQERTRAQHAEEQAEQERTRAEQERTRAQHAEKRSEQERTRAQHAEEQAEQERTRAQHAEKRSEQERTRAQHAEKRSEQERTRAQQAEERAERLAALLRAHGLSDEDSP